MSTTRNNTKVCGDNVSLLTDTVHSLEVNQDFNFRKLDKLVEKVTFQGTHYLLSFIPVRYIQFKKCGRFNKINIAIVFVLKCVGNKFRRFKKCGRFNNIAIVFLLLAFFDFTDVLKMHRN